MKVHWTANAESHLDAIHAHIARDSAVYALRMVDRITRKSQQIADFPLGGRIVPEYGVEQIREVFVVSFRIIYHIKPDQIDVLAVIHGAMNVLSEDDTDQLR